MGLTGHRCIRVRLFSGVMMATIEGTVAIDGDSTWSAVGGFLFDETSFLLGGSGWIATVIRKSAAAPSALVGNSDLASTAVRIVPAGVSMPGLAGGDPSAATLLLKGLSTLDGGSGASSSSSAKYAAVAALLGESAVPANARRLVPITASIAGAALFAATSESDMNAIVAIATNSALIVDPTKVTVPNLSRGHQVPSTAPPPTIPTLRIVPPAPPPPSYSVTPAANRNRRREER